MPYPYRKRPSPKTAAMIRDTYLRLLFIPLLGIMIPAVSGIITYKKYNTAEIIAANLYFILTSFCIWAGCQWIHGKMRPLYKVTANPFAKIFFVCAVSALYGASIGGIFTLVWYKFSREVFSWQKLWLFMAASSLAVIVFTLVYEILFLSKERELDTKIVDQLDKERSYAEMEALKNELDPHFIFNSLNTLSHIISESPEKAQSFNSKLAKVYKYFLINKDKELISLRDEMEFIENYFYLLQIRHDHKLLLEISLDGENEGKIMILPCALQVLVENAIKHNEFTEANPLKINISMNGQYLKVSNNTLPKPYLVNSTGIGLKNLRSRYKLVFHKDIIVQNTTDHFIVKLPVMK